MNISAATISHALHGLSHHSGTHPRGPVTFGQHLGAAAQQAGGQQAAGPQAASRADNAGQPTVGRPLAPGASDRVTELAAARTIGTSGRFP
jgi:hypothetical protein